ncbi:MAG: hypothetical protein WD024_01695 [Bacillota bacterium]
MYVVIAQHREGTFVGEKKQFVYFHNDPAVREGIMTAEFFPYRIALIRGS